MYIRAHIQSKKVEKRESSDKKKLNKSWDQMFVCRFFRAYTSYLTGLISLGWYKQQNQERQGITSTTGSHEKG